MEKVSVIADRAVLDAQMGSDTMRALLAVLGPCLAGRADIRIVDPLIGKGL
jgi:hypothetical protein